MAQSINNHRVLKSQSAMEYLMTYGWAILIIAVVLGALFSLGVFNSTSLVGNSCLASPGFECENPTLTTSGTLTFTFGQATAATLYNVQLACAATTATSGLPGAANAFNTISSTGAVLPWSQTGNSLFSSATVTVSSLQCFGTNGNPLGTINIGTGFSGYIWLNYTTQSIPEASGTNPWITSKVITLRTKVV